MSKTRKIAPAELRRIVKRHGGVELFAALVPVEPRTVWYWLAGRKMHPVFEARVREMGRADAATCRSRARRKRERENRSKEPA